MMMSTKEHCTVLNRRITDTQDQHNSLKSLLMSHIKQDIEREAIHERRHEESIRCSNELTESIAAYAKSTQTLVDVMTTGRTIAKFGKWLGSVAVFGVIISWGVDKFSG